jgi:hypothetical protein
MSLFLCCFFGGNIDKNYKNDNSNNNKKVNIKQYQVEQEEEQGEQEEEQGEQGEQKQLQLQLKLQNENVPIVSKETLNHLTDIEICQYWFTEILKYSIIYYHLYTDKKDLFNTIWNDIKTDNILNKYNLYNIKYNNFNKDNISSFCNDVSNSEFINTIKVFENIYRFH